MPNRRFDWHEHIKHVEGEYHAARLAVDWLKAGIVAKPDLLRKDGEARAYLRDADRNLEGTYLVRLFAAFEAALRSYDRARHNDMSRNDEPMTITDARAQLQKYLSWLPEEWM
jgi:hypothetical protein